VKQRPQIPVAAQDDMSSPSSITAIRAAHGCKLIAHEMFISSAAMATTTKDPDLVYKVAFLQNGNLSMRAAKIL
jgi:hypothetical protein